MRVALFSETFLPKVDGIANTLCRLLEHLQRVGVESLLFAPAGAPESYAATRVVGLRGLSFPLYPELTLVPPTVDVSDEIEAFDPDVVHVLNPIALGLAGIRHAQTLGRPVVASYHTDLPGFAQRWGLGFLAQPLWAYQRWLHNQADVNLAPSRATADEMQEHGIRSVAIWGRGVDAEQFHPRRANPMIRRFLTRTRDDVPLLLYVGRLSPEKRVEWLRPVLDALPHARLAIVGDGPSRPALERLFAGTATKFTGYLRGEELSAVYASADAFVFPGANETFGNVVLEAMASGLPVIAPRAGGVQEHVVDGQMGLLFEPENVGTLVMAVRWLLQDRDGARRMAKAARVYAASCSWGAVLDDVVAHYARVRAPRLGRAA